jgi:hypothetical protein
MAVIDQLTCLSAGSRKAGPVDNIVQPAFEHEQKVLARNTFLVKCLFEIIAKLFLEDEVDPFDLLLLAQLLAVPGEHLATCGSVLSRRVGAPLFDRTRGLEAPIALKE